MGATWGKGKQPPWLRQVSYRENMNRRDTFGFKPLRTRETRRA